MEWETVIGLEVHTQLATESKIFSGSPNQYGAEPNTHACAIDLGLPGVLPVLNKKVVELAVRFGVSIDAQIAKRSVFARKNYFYPDLPKGYQISQYELPIVGPGELTLVFEDGKSKKVQIERAHLEEDAGKSVHEGLRGATGVDLNRAGAPLLEIVSAPDMRSAKEAVTYLKTLHNLVRYIGISHANMQEGHFRCDVNISVRRKGTEKLGTRTEIKNLNSFRFVERAIEYEVDRQIDILEGGGEIKQETRSYDPDRNLTRTLRSKEDAQDYRYFPDPDLLPVELTDEFIEHIRSTLPELPWEKKTRYQEKYGLNENDATLFANDIDLADYFEKVLIAQTSLPPKMIANWLITDVTGALNQHDINITNCPIDADALAWLLVRVHDNTISNTMAKQVFADMWNQQGSADDIIKAKGLEQISDNSELEKMIDDIIANNPNQVEQYRAGKEKLFSFFVGQVMKMTKGKANPQAVSELLKRKLVN